MLVKAQFPGGIWDGSSPTRDSIEIEPILEILAGPDGWDYAQIVAEMRATQESLATILQSGFTVPPQSAARVFAGPVSGSPATPLFRALVATDIPDLDEGQITGLVSDLAGKADDVDVVHLTGTETITGTKTFSTVPKLPTQSANVIFAGPTTGSALPAFRALVASDIPSIAESQVTNLVSDLAAKAADSAVVHSTGNETIAGTKTFSSTISGDITGNAGTVTNGVVTTGSYSDPTWLTLSEGKITGLVSDLAAKAADSAVVHNTGNETIAGTKTFSSTISGSITGNAGTVTNGVVTTGSYSDPAWLTLSEGKITGLTADLAAKATDSLVVHLAGTESITGAKTFSSIPTLPTQTANTIFAGPTTGAAAAPTFRALVAADIPNIAESQVTGLVSDLAAKAADSAVVHNTGNETIAGTKTFSSTISGSITGNAGTVTNGVVTTGSYSDPAWLTLSEGKITGLTADLAAKATDSLVVHLAGTESITGAKTFSSVPTLPTQTANTHFSGPTTGSAAAPAFRALVAADLPTFVASGASHAAGAVPDPGATAGTVRFLREDASWAAPLVYRPLCNGRLTLTSGDPIELNTTGTTLYFTPFQGNLIGLYDGSNWGVLAFAETSVGVPGSTGCYDVFAYNNSGTLALETLIWTTTTTRATALVLQDGVYVKSGATTRRYLGTLYSNSGTCRDQLQHRWLWNYYNRIEKKVYTTETTANWTSNLAGAWRPANNNANGLSYVDVVVGVQERPIVLQSALTGNISSTTQFSPGISYDSTSATIHDLSQQQGPLTAGYLGALSSLIHTTAIGLHTYYWMENTAGGVVTLFSAAAGWAYAAGLTGQFPC